MRATKPTLKQKKIICNNGLNPTNWGVVRETTESLTIRHKVSGKVRTIHH